MLKQEDKNCQPKKKSLSFAQFQDLRQFSDPEPDILRTIGYRVWVDTDTLRAKPCHNLLVRVGSFSSQVIGGPG